MVSKGGETFCVTRNNIVKVLLLAFVLNVAILPAESGEAFGEKFSLTVRLLAWVIVGVISSFSLKGLLQFSSASMRIVLIYLCMFFVANFTNDNFSVKWMIFVSIMVCGGIIIQEAIKQSSRYMDVVIGSIECVIVFWVALYLLQLVIYLATHNLVNFHEIFVPYSTQRTELIAGGLARLGGVHIEPGTYANWLYGLLLLRALWLRRIFDRISLVALITLPMTLSLWGTIATFLILLAYFVEGKYVRLRQMVVWACVVFVAIFLNIEFHIYDEVGSYFSSRINVSHNIKQMTSTRAKILAYDSFVNNFGEYALLGKPYDYFYFSSKYSEQDLGIFVNTIVKVGGVWSFVMFYLIFRGVYRKLGFSGVLFALPLLIAKWFYWDQVFWLVVVAATGNINKAELLQEAKNKMTTIPELIGLKP